MYESCCDLVAKTIVIPKSKSKNLRSMRMCKCNVVQTEIFRRQNPVTKTLSVDLISVGSNEVRADLTVLINFYWS